MAVVCYGKKNLTVTKNNNYFKLFLSFGIMLTIIQQFPIVRDPFYGEIRLFLYFLFGLLFINRINKICLLIQSSTTIFFFLFSIILFLIVLLVLKLFGANIRIMEIQSLLVPFGILTISASLPYRNNEIQKMLTVYSVLAFIMGLSIIAYYGKGFLITRDYFFQQKNEVGVIIAIAIIISLQNIFIAFHKKKKFCSMTTLIFYIILFSALFTILLIIRNRNSVIAIILTVTFFFLIYNYKLRKRITLKILVMVQCILLILIILFFPGVFGKLAEPIYNSLTLNFDIHDINNLSAGRIEVYKESLRLLAIYPFFGESLSYKNLNKRPHNYLIKRCLSFGIIGSLPIIILYIYWWVFFFSQLKILNFYSFSKLSLFLLFFSLSISIFEYSPPYGPGTCQIITWFMIGQYIGNRNRINNKKY